MDHKQVLCMFPSFDPNSVPGSLYALVVPPMRVYSAERPRSYSSPGLKLIAHYLETFK